ncbi:type I 3-dehydroquinate dehydratase, partial [Neisseria gonorrhoeae]
VCRLKQMEDCGADICKIAVMPQSSEDVLTLLSATLEAKRLVAKPVITMSMGQTGAVSRLAGQVFGSSITFGSGTQNSAPGQIGVSALRAALDCLESGAD